MARLGLVQRVTIRGALGECDVSALTFNEWGAHRQIDGTLHCVTFVPFGLCLPLTWCSFPTLRQAARAARAIARLKNGWHLVTLDELKTMKAQFQAIARRYGAVEGPMTLLPDSEGRVFGRVVTDRLTGI